MGSYIDRYWTSTIEGPGLRTRDRASGKYRAYLPDLLATWEPMLDGATANDVEQAARAIAAFDATATTLTNTEALARLLLRAESVASSHMEGLRISPQRLLRADVEAAAGGDPADDTARAVLGNIAAMQHAIALDGRLSIDQIRAIHAGLLLGSRDETLGGIIRPTQNWIGGSPYNPLSAAFVPPPGERVPQLLADLCVFANRTDLPALVQAAIVHAQFETIHPFADGNGRTGRALIYAVLRRRGLAVHAIPPISLILATDADGYISALQGYRVDGDPFAPKHVSDVNDWIAIFAAAASEAVAQAQAFERRIATVEQTWRVALGARRADAASRRLLERLAARPVLTIAGVSALLGVSGVSASKAIDELVSTGILVRRSTGRRNQVFEARAVIDAFTDLERGLASADRDTRSTPPNRPVPDRPAQRRR